jgi:Secretion system C-terminal sorting domain/Periplasmic copper-binding protein (NosD)
MRTITFFTVHRSPFTVHRSPFTVALIFCFFNLLIPSNLEAQCNTCTTVSSKVGTLSPSPGNKSTVSAAFPNSSIRQLKTCIFGTFTIDVNFEFLATDIFLDDNAQIIVNAGVTLKINTTNVQACDISKKWNQISVLSGGHIEISNVQGDACKIKDSREGIILQGNNGKSISENAIFSNHNNACLTIRGTQEIALHKFENNFFSSAITGIRILNATNVNVGFNTYSTNTGCNMDHGTFISLNDGGMMTCPSKGVTMSKCAFINVKSLKINGNPTRGIEAQQCSGKMLIFNNLILNGLIGILVSQFGTSLVPGPSYSASLEIMENNISDVNSGIQTNNINGTDAMYLVNNQVSNFKMFGITAKDCQAKISALHNIITSNVAASTQIPGGISFTNCKSKNRLESNTIACAENKGLAFGILVSKCKDNQLAGNTFSGSLAFTIARAIRMENNSAGKSLLCCNGFETCARGIHLTGANFGRITGSGFSNLKTAGLTMENADLGMDQDWQGNNWNACSIVAGAKDAVFVGLPSVAKDNQFRTGGGLINNTLSKVIGPLDWFIISSSGNDLICTGVTSTSYCGETPFPFTSGGGGEITNLDVANLSATTELGYENVKFEAQRNLYEKLKAEPTLLNTSSVASNFYSIAQNNSIGKLYEIETGIRLIAAPLPILEAQEAAILQNLVNQRDQLQQISQQIASSTGTNLANLESQRANLLAAITTNAQSLELAKNQTSSDLVNRIGYLVGLNNAFVAQNDWEADEKALNTIVLNLLAQPEMPFTFGAQQIINAIAAKCPVINGHIVFSARELQSRYQIPAYDDEGCLPVWARTNLEPERWNSDNLSIFPNPTSDGLTISLKAFFEETTPLQIFDMQGKLLQNITWPANSSELYLDTRSFESGIYQVLLMRPDGFLLRKKFTITK